MIKLSTTTKKKKKNLNFLLLKLKIYCLNQTPQLYDHFT